MAQVTMDSKEYIELLDKARAWDRLHDKAVEDTVIQLGEDHYRGYHIEIANVLTDKAKLGIAKKVAEAVLTSDSLMRSLVAERTTVLDVKSGYIGHSWNRDNETEVDLMKIPEFKVRYEAINAELEEEQ